MKKKILSVLMTVAMVMSLFAGYVPAASADVDEGIVFDQEGETEENTGGEEEKGEIGETIGGKEINEYEYIGKIKRTETSVYFGSYPQTEIVSEASQSGVNGKSWAVDGDYEVDSTLYSELQNATSWNGSGDYTASDGSKYHRIKSGDATYVISGYDSYYNWASSTEYHYFRYDPIKWRVLEKDEDDAFLLSDVALDDQTYNTTNTDITWGTSTIRSWLNGYGSSSNACEADYTGSNFIDRAFTSEEQEAIKTTEVVNSNNLLYATSGGNTTQDKVFLLSESEVYGTGGSAYGFASDCNSYDTARRIKSSTYAKAMGTHADTDSSYLGNCNWWLRSPGALTNSAALVQASGLAFRYGTPVSYDNIGVCPALHLNLEASDCYTTEENVSTFSSSDVSLSSNSYTYDGTAKEPTVTISGLTQGTDYTVKYINNKNPGTATVEVEGTGLCSGTITKEFTISLPDATGSLTWSNVSYDYLYFGSYPQTEIVGEASQSGVYGKPWATSSDYEVNSTLYSELENATNWSESGDYTSSDGSRYHRINSGDATCTDSEYDMYYNWSGDAEYHYFRYDPIKWRVLETDGNDVFLLSEVVLDTQKYNTYRCSVTWENSTIRSWLNGYGSNSNICEADYKSNNFIDSAFTTEEQNAIITTDVVNSNNLEYGTAGGNKTQDKVFLLSESEVTGTGGAAYGFATKVYTEDEYRMAKSSTYAKAMGTYSYTRGDTLLGKCCWWLRSPGRYKDYAAFVNISGTVGTDYYNGYSVDSYNVGVRPALHLNSNSYTPKSAGSVSTTNKITVDAEYFSESTEDLYLYKGSALTPEVSVSGLKKGRDYEVSYNNNNQTGLASVTISGKGRFTGTVTKYFAITDEIDISDREISIPYTYCVYDGAPVCPAVTVKGLVQNQDYTVSYTDNDQPGIATITVRGINGYVGTITKEFKIYCYHSYGWNIEKKASCTEDGLMYSICKFCGYKDSCAIIAKVDESSIVLDPVVYTGKAIEPSFILRDSRGFPLTRGSEYIVAFSNNINAGTATVTITLNGSYTGTITKTFTISPKSISEMTAELSASSFTYDGKEKKPEVTIAGLTEGSDYTVAYSSNINAGTATATITGKGNYTGTIEKTFAISLRSISEMTAELSASSFTYDGTEKKPEVTIAGLTEGSDYTVAYSSNINAGTATATITGKGNYTGTITKTFTINPADISTMKAKVSGTSKTYTGSLQYPTVKVAGLVKGTDFKVSGAKNVGINKISITGIGNYTGTKTVSLKILPKKAAVSKLTVGKNKLTVNMSTAVSKTGGSTYEIQYRIKGKSSWSKKTTTKQSLTLSKLTKGKVYQVRVRAFKKVSGKTYYGSWSTVKTSGKVK